MSNADRDRTEEAGKARSAAADKPGAGTEKGAAGTPQKPLEANAKADAERTWGISDWFKIS
nr:hypothetical protein [Methylorubrum zatmanii]